jgi:hypothetical protein
MVICRIIMKSAVFLVERAKDCWTRLQFGCFLAWLTLWAFCPASEGGSLSHWQQRANTAAGPVAFGAGTFVSAGADGLILVSTNGQTWFTVQSGTTNHFSRAAYVDHRFICVGNYGTLVTSPDGLTWTPRNSGTTNWLSSVTYGNGLFVAVGGMLIDDIETQVITTSADGVQWQAKEQEGSLFMRIAYGDGHFVAIPSFDGSLLTSEDLSHWQTNWLSCTNGYAHEVIYTGSQFVAVGTCYDQPVGRSPIIATSSDGHAWIERDANAPGFGLGPVAYGAGLYVVTGSIPGYLTIDWITGQQTWVPDVPLLLWSSDGVSWRKEDVSGMPAFYDLGYGRGTFIAGGDRKIFQSDVLVPRFASVVELISLGFGGEVIGEVGSQSRLQMSTNLTVWTDLLRITNNVACTPFVDHSATNPTPRRYYRLATD